MSRWRSSLAVVIALFTLATAVMVVVGRQQAADSTGGGFQGSGAAMHGTAIWHSAAVAAYLAALGLGSLAAVSPRRRVAWIALLGLAASAVSAAAFWSIITWEPADSGFGWLVFEFMSLVCCAISIGAAVAWIAVAVATRGAAHSEPGGGPGSRPDSD